MKRLFAWVIPLVLASVLGAQAQALDDDYVRIFNLIQEADSLSSAQPSQALLKYREAQQGLDRLRKGSPDWNPGAVAFRMRYVATKIAALAPSTPAPAAPEGKATNQSAPPASAQELDQQLGAAREQIRMLATEKSNLEAKLKEALALQPAEVDPRELTRAQDKIKALQKENDLLKVSLESEKGKIPSARETKPVEPAAPGVADLNRQLAQQKELNSQLTLEKSVLESKIKQLSDASTANTKTASPVPDLTPQVKQLQRERDDLQKQLQDANKELGARKTKAGTKKVKDLEGEVTGLRARLAALEATKVPYSAEELALFKAPDTQLATPETTAPIKPREFPPGSAAMVSQAQTYFAAQQFDKAEATYREVLKLDDKNVPALANLASIQLEEKHFDDADATLKEALAVAPDDPHTLYVLGLLRFRQEKYDQAVDALSLSVKMDPKRAEAQSYLGLALSERGLRAPAEAALRKAIELQPNYARAHYNLAVFYLTQQPKYPALARWHYQKALSAGFPRSAEFEKLLEGPK
jgi:tetratricopeptide (TPR) repeat protein